MDSNETNKKTKIQLEIERNPEMDKLIGREISEQQLQKIISPTISPVIKNMNSIIQKNQASMLGLLQTNMNYALEPFKNSVLGQMQELVEVWKQAFSVKSARRMSEIISESVRRLRIPTLSEERKQELIEAHKLWGSYGWTMNPCENVKKIFKYMPTDKKSADAIALKQCSGQKMKQIFESISETKRVKKADFEEAVFDYNHRQYKSCALILFSLVDAVLIRLQKKSDLKGKRREVGLRAVSKAKTRTETDINVQMLFIAMFYTNLFACLEKVFEGGKDFKNQPDVINRNFLDHGMMTKKVRKKDCIQLFLLYYNMLELLDMIY